MTTPGAPSYAMPRDSGSLARMVADFKRQLDEVRPTITSAQTFILGAQTALTPEQFGDTSTGDGITDDSAAFQAMANSAQAGQSCVGSAGKTYTINTTINWPNDFVTWDGRGCAIQAGNARVDTNASEDRIFSFVSSVGIQVLNTRFLPGLSAPSTPSFGGKVYFAAASNCIVDHCTFDGEALPFGFTLALYGCHTVVVTNCYISRGTVGGYGNQSCAFLYNWSDGSLNNGFTGVGYSVLPSKHNLYEGNLITGRQRVGIEEYPSDAGQSYGHIYRRNTILAPAAGFPAAMGISAMGPRQTFETNYIVDPAFTGIESSGYGDIISDNIVWFTSTGHSAASGIQINSSDPAAGGDVGSTVTSNMIHRATIGIQLIGAVPGLPLAGVTLANNIITDPISIGIDCGATYIADGPTLSSNRVRFTEPATVATRIGIKSNTGAVLNGNQVNYETSSYAGTGVGRITFDWLELFGDSLRFLTAAPGSSNNDLPFHLVGNNVTMIGNKVDDGGRTDVNLLNSTTVAPPGSYSGWTFVGNTWGFSGVDKSGANGGTFFDLDPSTGFTAYTATWTGSVTNPTLGASGLALGHYRKIGTQVTGYAAFTIAGAGAARGSGIYRVGLPVAANSFYNTLTAIVGQGPIVGRFRTNGGGTWQEGSLVPFATGASDCFLQYVNAGAAGNVTDSLPAVFASGNSIVITFTYEAAA